MNTASQIVYEQRNASVGLGETIRFRLPTNIMLLNTQETYLRFNFVVGVKGKQAGFATGNQADEAHWFPWTMGDGGASNLIKNLVIRDYSSGVTLETINGYNLLNRVLVNYTKNDSEKNLDRLYGGADSEYVREKNTLTRRSQTAGTTTDGETQENMEIEVILPLRLSGVLNNPMPFPNALCPLEVEILLEDEVYKVLHAQANEQGGESANFEGDKDVQNINGGYRNNTICYKVDGTPTGVQTNVTILRTNDAGQNLYTGDLVADQVCDFPFYNGQECTVETSIGDLTFNIKNVEVDGANRLQLNFDALDFGVNATANPDIYITVPDTSPTCTLSELQLVCGAIQPSPQQMSAIENAVRSGNGYGWTYKSYQDFPVNNAANALQVSNLINCRFRMCKSILCFWENVGGSYLVEQDNLLPDLDTSVAPKNYQFKLSGLNVPNRAVELSRLNRTRDEPGAYNAAHIKELEQTLQCCGFQVKDLSNIDGCLLFGRGLVPAGSSFVFDMNDNEETRLNIKYTAQSQSLLQHNYICHMKQLLIKTSGKQVVE